MTKNSSGGVYRSNSLVVMDDFTKELLALEPATSMGSHDVIQILESTMSWNGQPLRNRSDNGSEFTSQKFVAWAYDKKIEHFLIQPGKPNQNAMVESLDGKIRDEFLNENFFTSLNDARTQSNRFREEYIVEREHSSLAMLTPWELKKKMERTISQCGVKTGGQGGAFA